MLVLTLLVSRCVRYCSVCSAPPGVVDRRGGLTQHAPSPEAGDGDLPTHITAEAAYTSVCQSPKVWWSSAGSRWWTLVCFHSFRQVLQYTVVEVTPITVVFTQSARVTRCRRSRCHQYRIAHYMNRLISLRRIYFLSRVPAVAGAVASVPAISTDRPSSRPSPESSSAQWFLRRHRWLRTHLERPSRHRPASALCPLTLAVSAVQRVRRVGRGIRGS